MPPVTDLQLPTGFLLFVALTVLTVYAQPAPLKLGAQRLAQLEERVLAAGRAGWQGSRPHNACPWLTLLLPVILQRSLCEP